MVGRDAEDDCSMRLIHGLSSSAVADQPEAETALAVLCGLPRCPLLQ